MKGCLDFRLRFGIPNDHCSIVEIDGENLVVEEQTDIGHGRCIFKQAFIEEGTVYGVNTLHAQRCSLVYARQTRE